MKNQTVDEAQIDQLAREIAAMSERDLAIALDFDGVCKLFTNHKHQIMFTCLFLHVPEFQCVPFAVFRNAYIHINFRSRDYAGKERFLCAWALSQYLAEQGYSTRLPGMDEAVPVVRKEFGKVSEDRLAPYAAGHDDVRRMIAWSHEVNDRVAQLTGIGLTPGIDENIFQPFRDRADYYVVSTATEGPLRESLERESVDYVKRYFGQETASKAEALLAMARSQSYRGVVMFGDSLEDIRAATTARNLAPGGVEMLFVPVIPDEEAYCFAEGRKVLAALLDNDPARAREICTRLAGEFEGREAGNTKAVSAPLSITE